MLFMRNALLLSLQGKLWWGRKYMTQPLRPGLLAEGPNSHFFKSLMPSESRDHSQEKDCREHSVALLRLASLAVARGLPMLGLT